MQERRYTVQSIHCGGCERAIREGFRHVEGVAEVAPDARTNTVEVRFDPTAIDDEPVRDRLTTLGFAPVDDHEQAPGDRQRLAR